MLGKFKISNHAYKMYDKRVKSSKENIGYAINRDLRTLNIRHIIRSNDRGEKLVYVFTRNSKEFIFVQGKKHLILKTVIKRSPEDTERTIRKRKARSR